MNKIGFAKCTVLGSYLEFGIYYQEGLFVIKNKNITIELVPSIFTSKLIKDEITILFGWKEIIEILKEDCRKRSKDCETMFAHLRFETDLKTLDDILEKFKDME